MLPWNLQSFFNTVAQNSQTMHMAANNIKTDFTVWFHKRSQNVGYAQWTFTSIKLKDDINRYEISCLDTFEWSPTKMDKNHRFDGCKSHGVKWTYTSQFWFPAQIFVWTVWWRDGNGWRLAIVVVRLSIAKSQFYFSDIFSISKWSVSPTLVFVQAGVGKQTRCTSHLDVSWVVVEKREFTLKKTWNQI